MKSELISQYYADHRDELLAYVSSRLHVVDDAEVMVQDVFLRLLSGYELISSVTLPSLAYTTARNLICDFYRRRQHRDDYEHYLRNTAQKNTDNTLSVLSVSDITKQIEHSLAHLSEQCREVYRLHIYEGMGVSNISQTLNQSYKAVEYRLGLARKEVRRRFNLYSISAGRAPLCSPSCRQRFVR